MPLSHISPYRSVFQQVLRLSQTPQFLYFVAFSMSVRKVVGKFGDGRGELVPVIVRVVGGLLLLSDD